MSVFWMGFKHENKMIMMLTAKVALEGYDILDAEKNSYGKKNSYGIIFSSGGDIHMWR